MHPKPVWFFTFPVLKRDIHVYVKFQLKMLSRIRNLRSRYEQCMHTWITKRHLSSHHAWFFKGRNVDKINTVDPILQLVFHIITMYLRNVTFEQVFLKAQ